MGLLQPEVGVLFWMTLAFAVVFIVLARYGFPVIVRAIEERKAYIDRSLEEARAAERKLRELAIVIDTSASCSRGLTGWFLRAVHDILLRERLFFDRFRLHILQCDCEVQQDTLVTNLEEFQWYLDHLELYGGGGTDFRPALRRIDELVESGELPHLGGVLYFTDGYGVFPEREPAYPVAFVMLRYRYDDINIPRWAIRLVLDADKPGRDEGWI